MNIENLKEKLKKWVYQTNCTILERDFQVKLIA